MSTPGEDLCYAYTVGYAARSTRIPNGGFPDGVTLGGPRIYLPLALWVQ